MENASPATCVHCLKIDSERIMKDHHRRCHISFSIDDMNGCCLLIHQALPKAKAVRVSVHWSEANSKAQCDSMYIFLKLWVLSKIIYILQKKFLSLLSGSLYRRHKTTLSLVNSPLLKKENYLASHQRFLVIVTKHPLPKSSRVQAILCSHCCSVAKLSLTPCCLWTAVCQPSPSFTLSRSLLRLMFTESVMPIHLILRCSSPPALNLSQHWGLFPCSRGIDVAKGECRR